MDLTGKRALQLLLAVVLVAIGFVAIMSVPWKHWVRELQKPSSQAVVARLTSPDAAERRAGLSLLGGAAVRPDPGITKAVTGIALSDPDAVLRAEAIAYLSRASGYAEIPGTPHKALPQETIDAITTTLSASLDPRLAPSVIEFVGANAYWHPKRDEVIARLTALFTQTQDRALREKILYALQKFAQDRGLPEDAYTALLEVYTDRRRVAAHEVRAVSEIFRRAAFQQALPAAVTEAVAVALRSHPDEQVRDKAISILGGQAYRSGSIPTALAEAAQGADPKTRERARTQITVIEKRRSDYLDKLMKTARDRSEPANARIRALGDAKTDHAREDLFRDTLLLLLTDEDPAVRASAVRTLLYLRKHPSYAADDSALLAYQERAAQDPAGEVRIAAMVILWGFRLTREELFTRFAQVLEDKDPAVVTATLDSLRRHAPLEDERIERLIEQHARTGNAGVRRSAELTLAQYRRKPPSAWERLIASTKDVRHHGLRVYWFLAGIGILIAAAFAVYYMLRIIVYVGEHRSRALTAGGVMLVWVALTCGMVYLFVVGIFAFGHNYLVPVRQQLLIDLVIGGALLVYAGLGWAMHYLIRR